MLLSLYNFVCCWVENRADVASFPPALTSLNESINSFICPSCRELIFCEGKGNDPVVFASLLLHFTVHINFKYRVATIYISRRSNSTFLTLSICNFYQAIMIFPTLLCNRRWQARKSFKVSSRPLTSLLWCVSWNVSQQQPRLKWQISHCSKHLG